jgi:hypothetical protein
VRPFLVETALVVPSGHALTGTVSVPVQNPQPPPGQGEEFGKASPVALVVIILLALATILLIRSMTKRLRRLPASFESSQEPAKSDDASDSGEGRKS